MAGEVRAGALFFVVALVVTIPFSLIPLVGMLCCGPIGALAYGIGAGALGARWRGATASVGQGALSGGLAGVGALIGATLAAVISVVIAQSDPEMIRQMLREALAQSDGVEISPDDLAALLLPIGALVGFCIGMINLVASLLSGMLGAWITISRRPAATL
ncbi:MAG: hypothetical protein KGS47_05955 [Chloroflexi bacterium]|nr:hypothetical protein [Chloroflexota bacterium]